MVWTVVLLLLLAPVVAGILRGRATTREAYSFNDGRTGVALTMGSAVCCNVGVGTFIAILLFSRVSPVIGLALVVCYTAGLLLCALAAPSVHALAARHRAFSFVDLIVARTQASRAGLIAVWLPVAFVFILRSAVQLAALALLVGNVFGVDALVALVASGAAIGAYTLIGGYRSATQTDAMQAVVIVALMAVAATGLTTRPLNLTGFLDLGPYAPTILVGIVLLLPFSPLLSVDNWQRIATARTASIARRGYLGAAAICCAIYSIIWIAGMDGRTLGAEPLDTFRGLMPAVAPWLADVLFITAIVSSVDTFLMPLVAPLAQRGVGLARLRIATAALLFVTALLAATMGDLLSGVVAAFSVLVVFLPAVFATMVLRRPSARAAALSMNGGLAASLIAVTVDENAAAIVGFVVATLVYAAVSLRVSGAPRRDRTGTPEGTGF